MTSDDLNEIILAGELRAKVSFARDNAMPVDSDVSFWLAVADLLEVPDDIRSGQRFSLPRRCRRGSMIRQAWPAPNPSPTLLDVRRSPSAITDMGRTQNLAEAIG
jgi:hypothetical protein